MQGLFRANGGCGYVKKPDLFLKNGPDDKIFDPKNTLPVKKTLKVSQTYSFFNFHYVINSTLINFRLNNNVLKVKVYMGDGWHLDFKRTHFDIYSPPDFYVKVHSTTHFPK